MQHFVTAALVIVAIIHLLPLAGVLGPARLTAFYAVAVLEPNLGLLLRHRAMLFGVSAPKSAASMRTAFIGRGRRMSVLRVPGRTSTPDQPSPWTRANQSLSSGP